MFRYNNNKTTHMFICPETLALRSLGLPTRSLLPRRKLIYIYINT